ncbi:MAG: hypothetical protein ABSF24_11970 [Candidatus Bathyarchaeia archaeon]|jgi:hypothetical protein
MRRLLFIVVLSSLLLALAFVQRGDVSVVKASSSFFQGDLVLTGNNVTVIEGSFDINGSIVVEGNATLVLRNAVLNFTQTKGYQFNMTFQSPANGNPRLQAENVSITASDHYFYMSFRGNSSATGYNITSNYYVILWTYDDSVMSISNSSGIAASALQNSALSIYNSTISMVSCYDSSEVYIYNSEITEAAVIGPKTINCTISKLGPGFFSYWSFITNSSPTIPPGGGAPNMTLNNTSVSNWRLHASGSSNITIANAVFLIIYAFDSSLVSMIDSTVTDSISLGGTSVVSLVNSTYSSAYYSGTASIQVAWYLDVQVVDSTGQEVKAANITAIYPNATMAGWKLTDERGGARLTLMEKVMNATGDYPVGNYTVEAKYASYSNETTMNMTQNWQVALSLADLVIPEFPSIQATMFFMLLTLLTVIICKKKDVKTSQS